MYHVTTFVTEHRADTVRCRWWRESALFDSLFLACRTLIGGFQNVDSHSPPSPSWRVPAQSPWILESANSDGTFCTSNFRCRLSSSSVQCFFGLISPQSYLIYTNAHYRMLAFCSQSNRSFPWQQVLWRLRCRGLLFPRSFHRARSNNFAN